MVKDSIFEAKAGAFWVSREVELGLRLVLEFGSGFRVMICLLFAYSNHSSLFTATFSLSIHLN